MGGFSTIPEANLFNGIMADTVGVVWSAASGTVDPWTKQQEINDEAAAIVEASGGSITPEQAQTQAESDVTASYQAMADGVSADPADFWQSAGANLKRNVATIGNTIKPVTDALSKPLFLIALILIVGLAAYFLILTPAGARVTS